MGWQNVWQECERIESAVTQPEAHMLYTLACACREGHIVEIGSYRGRSSVALLRGAEVHNVPVWCVDPWRDGQNVQGFKWFGEDAYRRFNQTMRQLGLAPKMRRQKSHEAAREMRDELVDDYVSLAFIDGDHSVAGVQLDWTSWSPLFRPGTIVAWHDYTIRDLGVYPVVDELRQGKLEDVDLVDTLLVTRVL